MRQTTQTLLFLVLACSAPQVRGAFWNLGTGGSWNTVGNWNPSGVPNGVGAPATFNGAATAFNPAQTGNRTITLDAAQTVGSLLFNTDLSTFTNTLSTGSSGSLTFDEAGVGPASITTSGAGTGNNTISAAMTLTDSLAANVNNTAASSAAGSLNLTGTVTGAGGVTKTGDGLMTYGTGAKSYTGATIVTGGRLRISLAAAPTATSGLTVNAGGQLTQISAGSYALGSGSLTLNGSGPTTGPFAAFPGALRPDTNLAITITNATVLQSDSLIHVQGSSGGKLTFSGGVSGPGRLLVGAVPHDANLGQVLLAGTGAYTGGTRVQGGTLSADAASLTAFGTGNVTVESASMAFAGSVAKLQIVTGASNAISDTATLALSGGSIAGVADDGFVDLGASVNEVVGGLVLGGITQFAPGTYGSTASGATYQFDEFFAGTGVVTLVPEPAMGCLVIAAIIGWKLRRGRRSPQTEL